MLNATSSQNNDKLYPLAALFVYANNQEVTKQKIIAVLKALDVNVESKRAELFESDVLSIKNMLTSISSGSASASPVAEAAAPVKEEEKAPAKEEEIEEFGIDFGDDF